MAPVSDLIDTTEMYLRTIYELEEEGITRSAPGLPSGCNKAGRRCRRRSPGWSATTSYTSKATGISS